MSDLCQAHGGSGFSLYGECPLCKRDRLLQEQTDAIRGARDDAEARHREDAEARRREERDERLEPEHRSDDVSYHRAPMTEMEVKAFAASNARTAHRTRMRVMVVPWGTAAVGVMFGLIVTNKNAEGGKILGAAIYGVVAYFVGRFVANRLFPALERKRNS